MKKEDVISFQIHSPHEGTRLGSKVSVQLEKTLDFSLCWEGSTVILVLSLRFKLNNSSLPWESNRHTSLIEIRIELISGIFI